ncbi:hypothetical protein EDM76_13675, partial [bacterium]
MNARGGLLPALEAARRQAGTLGPPQVEELASRLGIPAALAWEAASSFPDFRHEVPAGAEPVCMGAACLAAGATAGPGQAPVECQFRCYSAPAPGLDAPFPENAIRLAGPLLAPEDANWRAIEAARAAGPHGILAELELSGLRGRGGAYFPVAAKWKAALGQGRPVALVINAEEGEPGVFKDRAILCRRPRRFVEGLAIAMEALAPAVTVVFVNGRARAALASLEAALSSHGAVLASQPRVVVGGGGYVLGEETTLLNAIEGRKPVPRVRPPYPVESGLWGMPTVVNNVETISSLPVIFREGAAAFRARGLAAAPGTRLLSVSGAVARPGVYEAEMGVTIARLLELAGHYHFAPQPCRPRRGNEKGRVERRIRDLRTSFFAGREFHDIADLRRQFQQWRDDVAYIRPCLDQPDITVQQALDRERPL